MEGKDDSSNEKPSQDEMFDFCGPIHLTNVDWSISEHKRSVAASLVKGVYVTEIDRQKKRSGHNKLAPKWWEFFHYQPVKTLEDKFDSSIFGIIFQYKPPQTNYSAIKDVAQAPKYVIAFRGTLLKKKTAIRDCYLDAKIVLKGLDTSSRYEMAFHALEEILLTEDPKNIWLAGHSLGAAIALHTGKNMAKHGYCLETYLFNPPYASPSVEKIHNRHLRNGARLAVGIVKTGLSIALTRKNKRSENDGNDPFSTLRSWIPWLFVNPEDPICRDYSGYFEDRGKSMNNLKNSLLNMVVDALGRDGEAHLIPSAVVIKNMKNTIVKENGLIAAHELCQWWEQHSCWHYKLYKHN
ncbi:GDSL esterase/lipase At4g10955-like [Amaranthus tricolor]|uniref:GDSL esterase/lipase At4g10955-like n=1 Tax=Amaranthus tricolor TaxID=29722 RepID=UPI002586FE16|nr:GDSL esterase/lipase At4g10955-like [Amaranthus tricolor]